MNVSDIQFDTVLQRNTHDLSNKSPFILSVKQCCAVAVFRVAAEKLLQGKNSFI